MPLDTFTLVFIGWVINALLMAGLWFIHVWRRNAGIVDIGWCLGLIVTALLNATWSYGDPARRVVFACIVMTYAVLLGLYLFPSRVLSRVEDSRYRNLRERWGRPANGYFFWVFQAQALGVALFSFPILVLMENPRPTFSLWELAGSLVWVIAVAGETLANQQLARFRADPRNRGRTCREGLWRYSRHPNYFFEWLHWCAYAVMAIGVPRAGLAWVNAILMLVFLIRITGIPPVEAQALAIRGDDYRDYQRTTNAFFPWFPRAD